MRIGQVFAHGGFGNPVGQNLSAWEFEFLGEQHRGLNLKQMGRFGNGGFTSQNEIMEVKHA